MAYERLGARSLDYEPCRYDGSKLLFRGPKRCLDGKYVACLGGTETYGKFIANPYPAMLERATGLKCVNLGWPNAGVDVFLHDQGVVDMARRAEVVVLQVPCAQNVSNRYYTVHPRRNDRFLKAKEPLRSLYPMVDFTEFHFTRHLLGRLQAVSLDRFHVVRTELQALWRQRMAELISQIDTPIVLLWFSTRAPGQAGDSVAPAQDPAFVTREMIESIRPDTSAVVEAVASRRAQEMGTRGMRFSEVEASAALKLLGPVAHEEATTALVPVIQQLMTR